MPAKKRNDGFMASAAKYTAAAMALPSAVLAGYFIGYLLDRWLGTTYLRIVFLILGVVAGFFELVRVLLRDMNRENQNK